jgi:hypothetical protein
MVTVVSVRICRMLGLFGQETLGWDHVIGMRFVAFGLNGRGRDYTPTTAQSSRCSSSSSSGSGSGSTATSRGIPHFLGRLLFVAPR